MKKIGLLIFLSSFYFSTTAQNNFKISGDFIIKASSKNGKVSFTGASIQCDTLHIDDDITEITIKEDFNIICKAVVIKNGSQPHNIEIIGKDVAFTISSQLGKLPPNLQFSIGHGSSAKFILTRHN